MIMWPELSESPLILYTCYFSVQVVDLVDKWVAGVMKMRLFRLCRGLLPGQVEFLYQQSQDLDTKSWESGMLTEFSSFGFQYVVQLDTGIHKIQPEKH